MKTTAARWYYRIACCVLFFAASAASFNGYYDKYRLLESGTVNPEFRQTFEAMVDGTAPRPFVYRQLLPWMANSLAGTLDRVMPDGTKAWLYRGHDGKPVGVRFLDSPIVGKPEYLLRYLVLYTIEFFFVWLAVYAMYWLARAAGNPRAASALAAIGMILIMPLLLTSGGYFYDYPELAFMVLAVWMAIRFEWWWMIPLAAVATWNKESFLLFIPTLYPLLRLRASRRGALIGMGALMSTCAAVYYGLRKSYESNPGGTVEVHFQEQIDYFLHLSRTFWSTEKTYGLLLVRGAYLVAAVLVTWTVWRAWHLLPQALQRHAQIATAINLPLFVVLCAPGELRDLSMLYVTLLLSIAVNVTEWLRNQSSEAGSAQWRPVAR